MTLKNWCAALVISAGAVSSAIAQSDFPPSANSARANKKGLASSRS